MRFYFGWKSHFSVQSTLYLCSHELKQNKTQNGMDLYRSFWPKWNFKPAWGFHVNIIYPKRNEWVQARWMLRLMHMCAWNLMRVWTSYRSFWHKSNFISGDKISCKHYPKWNAYRCPSKYRVVLKCSRNETSCEQNLFSRRFEISNRYEFIFPLMWTYSMKSKLVFWVTYGYYIF